MRTRTTKQRTIETAEKDARAARLRSRGLTYDAIAKELKYSNRSAARKAVQRALASVPREAAEELLALEVAKLHALDAEAWKVLEKCHVVVSDGRIVKDDDGDPLLDSMPVLRAIDTLRRNSERLSKLLGLDAPTRHEVLTLDAIDAEIARLSAELGSGATATPAPTPATAV